MRVWNDSETLRRLRRYRAIIDNRVQAKYLHAKEYAVDVRLDADTDELWETHTRASAGFRAYVQDVDKDRQNRMSLETGRISFLALKVELARRILQSCHFCERQCGADRAHGKKGWCRLGSESRVSSAFLHTGEEAPLIPSGTIFFSSCCFGCVFCQNYDISTAPRAGMEVTPQHLARIADSLYEEGAININYVGGDPIPNTHTILASMEHQVANVTQLWNSNLYCSMDTMRLISDVFDVWLPDFKYGNNECAEHLSGVKNYFEVVARNHILAYESGEVIVRHLVLPNHIECCTRPILEWLSKNIPNCMVNIMAQYRPEHLVRARPTEYPEITRHVHGNEMRIAYETADELGLCYRPVS